MGGLLLAHEVSLCFLHGNVRLVQCLAVASCVSVVGFLGVLAVCTLAETSGGLGEPELVPASQLWQSWAVPDDLCDGCHGCSVGGLHVIAVLAMVQ